MAKPYDTEPASPRKSLITIDINIDNSQLPEWMPEEMVGELVDEINDISREFISKGEAIRERFEKKIDDHLGSKVIAFRCKS